MGIGHVVNSTVSHLIAMPVFNVLGVPQEEQPTSTDPAYTAMLKLTEDNIQAFDDDDLNLKCEMSDWQIYSYKFVSFQLRNFRFICLAC